jgi:hypothetical protein
LALDVSDVCISDELQSRAEELFEKERIVARKRSIRRRIVAIAIAAVLLALTACMTIPTVREKLYKIVITYCDEYFSYKSEPVETDEVTQPAAGADTQEAAMEDSLGSVFEKRLPTYLPEGFEVIGDSSTTVLTCIDYGHSLDGTTICYEQSLIGTKRYEANSEHVQIQEIQIDGNDGVATFESAHECIEITMLWNDGIYDYYLRSTLSLEETLKIAQSIH